MHQKQIYFIAVNILPERITMLGWIDYVVRGDNSYMYHTSRKCVSCACQHENVQVALTPVDIPCSNNYVPVLVT